MPPDCLLTVISYRFPAHDRHATARHYQTATRRVFMVYAPAVFGSVSFISSMLSETSIFPYRHAVLNCRVVAGWYFAFGDGRSRGSCPAENIEPFSDLYWRGDSRHMEQVSIAKLDRSVRLLVPGAQHRVRGTVKIRRLATKNVTHAATSGTLTSP